ncbi:MAG: ATP-binding protein [Acidobacteriota bacterium]|nr:ATP-binding protein [Acidobacteriota bacterium]
MNTAASVARIMGFPEDRIEDLKTAIAEACINAIEHGNKLNEALLVGVNLNMTPDTLEVRVHDTGTGPSFPVEVPDIDKKMHEQQQPRGMGIFLIRSLVDEAEWVSTPGGSYARLLIRLHPEPIAAIEERD